MHWKTGLLLVAVAGLVGAQQPVLRYGLQVKVEDTSLVEITLRARNLPDPFHLAMVKHFLVDDEYWRYIEDMRISAGTIAREQDGVWRVKGAGSDATVTYKVRLSEKGAFRVVRKPFLTATGGLVGDLHMFLYVVEAADAPAHVTLELPTEWKIATALTPTADPRTFWARDGKELSDSPLLVGELRESRFAVDQVPVRVAYWALPNAPAFDMQPLVKGLQAMVQRAGDLFGGLPWREYVFQVRDGTDVEGFEHTDGVTVGVPSADLAAKRNPDYVMIAHEFIHGWNMMRTHSAEYKGISYKPVELTGLWVSEGFTVFLADLLVRRAGLPTPMPTRVAYLEDLIAYYLANPEHERYSAEEASRGAFRPPIGDAHPDRYMLWIQSELLAAMLDLSIREATNGGRSLDDLMRALYAGLSGQRGFTTADIERLAAEVSGRSMKGFFDAYVRRAGRIDVNRFLKLAGLEMGVTSVKAKAPDGALRADTRVYAMRTGGESRLRVYLTHPMSGWLRAGLRNGDELVRVNGRAVVSEGEFNDLLNGLRVGNEVRLEVLRGGKLLRIGVKVEGYDWPEVKIRPVAGASERQRAIRERWEAGR